MNIELWTLSTRLLQINVFVRPHICSIAMLHSRSVSLHTAISSQHNNTIMKEQYWSWILFHMNKYSCVKKDDFFVCVFHKQLACRVFFSHHTTKLRAQPNTAVIFLVAIAVQQYQLFVLIFEIWIYIFCYTYDNFHLFIAMFFLCSPHVEWSLTEIQQTSFTLHVCNITSDCQALLCC